jgi:hypothetical protein
MDWISLLLGITVTAMAIVFGFQNRRSWRDGSVPTIFFSTAKREQKPIRFWLSMFLMVAFNLLRLAAGLDLLGYGVGR